MGDALGLREVGVKARKAERANGGGVGVPKMGDVKHQIGEPLYAAVSPSPKKPMTAFCPF